MKLFDRFWGQKKKTQNFEQKSTIAPIRHPPTKKPSSAALEKTLPKKQSDADRSTLRPQGPYASEQCIFLGSTCEDNNHDFARPYPFICRKCGLECRGNSEEIVKYMGSYFDGVSYKWHPDMQKKEIVSFSLSTGDRPVFEANCDFSHLRIRNCLNGSRDGWMQSQFAADYFEPKEVELEEADILKLKKYLVNCDFSTWETPSHYAENQIMGACGFHVDETFTCRFANGRKFTCLKLENAEFKQLVSMLREIAGANAKKEDRKFVQRMLDDTEKKEKQIY